MSQNNDKIDSGPATSIETVIDERGANALILMIRRHGQRRQALAEELRPRCLKTDRAEKNVPNDQSVEFSRQREKRLAVTPKRVDEIRLRSLSKRRGDDPVNRGVIFGRFRANNHRNF